MNRILLVGLAICASFSTSAYELVAPNANAISENTMRNKAGAPTIWFGKRNPDCKKDCSKQLNLGGRVYNFSPEAELQVQTRYQDRAFALVRDDHINKSGKKSSRDRYHFIGLGMRKAPYKAARILCEGAQARGFSYDGELLCLNKDKIVLHTVNSERDIALPIESSFGQINNNLAGTVSIAFVNADKQVLHYTNLYNLDRKGEPSWQTLPTRLHNRSDRRNVIATYPANRNSGIVAMYEYINVFNKGLTLYSFGGKQPQRHVLTNSDKYNFGFGPEVFMIGSQYVVTAKDSNNSKDNIYKSYAVEPSALLTEDQYYNEKPAKSYFDFMAGYGLTYNQWDASQSVGDSIETKYKIEPSLLHSIYFQGRYGDTQATVKYLTNKAKESGPNGTSDAVDMLTGLIDFHGFFEGADTLRLQMDWTETHGTATYKSTDSDFFIDGHSSFEKAFTTEYTNIEALWLQDGGNYIGLSYSTYAMPSAIGFTSDQDSDTVIGAALDEDYEQARLMLLAGSDEATYGARYETDYDRLFFRPNLGFGFVKHKISKEAEQRARNGYTNSISGKTGMVLSAGVDIGYIYQRRWREASGLGFSIQTGVRGRLEYAMDNVLAKTGDDEIHFDYDRSDIMWGPYVQFNAIF